MIDLPAERLPSSQLEDLAFIILSARADQAEFDLYPDLDSTTRSRLRSRLKQLSRYDFPSSLGNDPALRRGYTLRQCCRLAVALLLLDDYLPPSLIVALVRNNEIGFLRAMMARLTSASPQKATSSDLLAIVLPAEIQDALAIPCWQSAEPERVRFIRRSDLTHLWSGDLAGSGSRLVVDVATATGALWRWISGRRLMTDVARTALIEELDRTSTTGFSPEVERRLRR